MATPATGLARRHVNVVKVNIGGQDRAFVIPAAFGLGNPPQVSSVTWTNGTGDDAFLWFPNGEQLFDPDPGDDPVPIPASGLTLNVSAKAKPGDYHYHVYCKAVNDCAQGHSEPRISVP